jgi:hypothetical protein
MEQSLYDILINASGQMEKLLLETLNEKPLYYLLIDARGKSNKDVLSINRKYAKLSTGNSVKYCINPKYLNIPNVNELKKVIYSVIRDAFREYKHEEKENIEILLNYGYQAENVKRIKKGLEESCGFRCRYTAFYKVPVLEKALDFSMKNLSVKAVRPDSLKEYI